MGKRNGYYAVDTDGNVITFAQCKRQAKQDVKQYCPGGEVISVDEWRRLDQAAASDLEGPFYGVEAD